MAHSARLQTLIAHLVLHRSAPVVRKPLACVFWPDTSESQARTNLRNLIHQLHQAVQFISDYVTFDSSTLKWRSECAFCLDVDEFRRWLTTAPGQSPAKEGLENAVRLYQGDLFPACCDDWIAPIQEEPRSLPKSS